MKHQQPNKKIPPTEPKLERYKESCNNKKHTRNTINAADSIVKTLRPISLRNCMDRIHNMSNYLMASIKVRKNNDKRNWAYHTEKSIQQQQPACKDLQTSPAKTTIAPHYPDGNKPNFPETALKM